MPTTGSDSPQMFRLWIATYADWRPSQWNQSPPRATALELVDDSLYGADEAALFLEGFNSAMLDGDRRLWAVAVPITVRYEGDAQPGTTVVGYAFASSADRADRAPADASGNVSGNASSNVIERRHF